MKRQKIHTPLAAPSQAPPASRILDPRLWTPLIRAFGQLMSLTATRADALRYSTWCVQSGQLRLALVALDSMDIIWEPDASECQNLTVHAALNFEETVWIEPRREGRWYAWRADLARLTTIPAAPATPADRQPRGSKPAAATPHPGGRKPAVNWTMVDKEVFRLMDHHGEFSDDDPKWNAQARLEEAIADFCQDKFKKVLSETPIREHVSSALERWRLLRSET